MFKIYVRVFYARFRNTNKRFLDEALGRLHFPSFDFETAVIGHSRTTSNGCQILMFVACFAYVQKQTWFYSQ